MQDGHSNFVVARLENPWALPMHFSREIMAYSDARKERTWARVLEHQ